MTFSTAICAVCSLPFLSFSDDLIPCRVIDKDGKETQADPVWVCPRCNSQHVFE